MARHNLITISVLKVRRVGFGVSRAIVTSANLDEGEVLSTSVQWFLYAHV